MDTAREGTSKSGAQTYLDVGVNFRWANKIRRAVLESVLRLLMVVLAHLCAREELCDWNCGGGVWVVEIAVVVAIVGSGVGGVRSETTQE